MSSHALQRLTSQRFVIAGGLIRPYTVVLPRGYDPRRAYPVIMGFGGWKHNPSTTRSYQHLESAAGNRAIVIYPQGVRNAWGGAPYARMSLRADIDYVRTIVGDLSRSHNIDRGRVYAAGFSNGGGMAAALACHAPELVAGVATVSGAFYEPVVSGCSGRSVPMLIMHADNDPVINYNGGNRHGSTYKSAQTIFFEQGSRNGCTMNEVNQWPAGRGTTFTPRQCRARTEMLKVAGGGHSWFGTPNATEQAVRFFLG